MHAGAMAGSGAAPDPQARRRRPGAGGLPGRLRGRRGRDRHHGLRAHRAGGDRRAAHRPTWSARASTWTTCGSCPMAGRTCWWSSAGRSATRRTGARREFRDDFGEDRDGPRGVQALRRPRGRSEGLGGARIGARRHGPRPGHARTPGPAGRTRPCPPSGSGDYLRDFRHYSKTTSTTAPSTAISARGCSTPASTSQLDDHAGIERSCASFATRPTGGGLRRIALRRARRRAGARRLAVQDVRPPHRRRRSETSSASGIPSGGMNPGKVVDADLPDDESGVGPDWDPSESRQLFAFPDDDGSFARRDAPLRGRGQVPPTGRRDDVPELHGHARGAPLDARAGAHPQRDDARRDHHATAGRATPARGARPVSVLQGVQGRLPRERGHGHLQGRVHGPPLRRAACDPGSTTRSGGSGGGRGWRRTCRGW